MRFRLSAGVAAGVGVSLAPGRTTFGAGGRSSKVWLMLSPEPADVFGSGLAPGSACRATRSCWHGMRFLRHVEGERREEHRVARVGTQHQQLEVVKVRE